MAHWVTKIQSTRRAGGNRMENKKLALIVSEISKDTARSVSALVQGMIETSLTERLGDIIAAVKEEMPAPNVVSNEAVVKDLEAKLEDAHAQLELEQKNSVDLVIRIKELEEAAVNNPIQKQLIEQLQQHLVSNDEFIQRLKADNGIKSARISELETIIYRKEQKETSSEAPEGHVEPSNEEQEESIEETNEGAVELNMDANLTMSEALDEEETETEKAFWAELDAELEAREEQEQASLEQEPEVIETTNELTPEVIEELKAAAALKYQKEHEEYLASLEAQAPKQEEIELDPFAGMVDDEDEEEEEVPVQNIFANAPMEEEEEQAPITEEPMYTDADVPPATDSTFVIPDIPEDMTIEAPVVNTEIDILDIPSGTSSKKKDTTKVSTYNVFGSTVDLIHTSYFIKGHNSAPVKRHAFKINNIMKQRSAKAETQEQIDAKFEGKLYTQLGREWALEIAAANGIESIKGDSGAAVLISELYNGYKNIKAPALRPRDEEERQAMAKIYNAMVGNEKTRQSVIAKVDSYKKLLVFNPASYQSNKELSKADRELAGYALLFSRIRLAWDNVQDSNTVCVFPEIKKSSDSKEVNAGTAN